MFTSPCYSAMFFPAVFTVHHWDQWHRQKFEIREVATGQWVISQFGGENPADSKTCFFSTKIDQF